MVGVTAPVTELEIVENAAASEMTRRRVNNLIICVVVWMYYIDRWLVREGVDELEFECVVVVVLLVLTLF